VNHMSGRSRCISRTCPALDDSRPASGSATIYDYDRETRDAPAPIRLGVRKAAMEGNDSIEVKLPRSIPILILYGTALVEDDGRVHFFNDIYGFDASLQTALRQRHDNSQ
jgi:hypothetical protein